MQWLQQVIGGVAKAATDTSLVAHTTFAKRRLNPKRGRKLSW
jgi:hypothetical protein